MSTQLLGDMLCVCGDSASDVSSDVWILELVLS